MNKTLSLLVLLALTAGPAAAVPALQDLGREAGVDTAVIAQRIEASRALAASAPRTLMIPRGGKDVLEGCTALDVKTFVALNPKQAAVLVQTCLNHAYAADGAYSVRAQAEASSLKIVVAGEILDGNPVLLDLTSTLQARGGRILGFPAVLDSQVRVKH